MLEQRHKIKLMFSPSGLNRFQQFGLKQMNKSNDVGPDRKTKRMSFLKKKKKIPSELRNVLCEQLLKDGTCAATVQAEHRSKPK